MGTPSIEPAEFWHGVQLYQGDAFLAEAVSSFIGRGLEAGEGVIVIAASPHGAAFDDGLKKRGLDPDAARNRGQYLVLDAADTLASLLVNGWPDRERFTDLMVSAIAKASGDGKRKRVRTFGEMVTVLWDAGQQAAAIHLEELWCELAQAHRFSLLCAYPMAGFGDEARTQAFLRICDHHSHVLPAESYMGLASQDERLKAIAQLQQKAKSLEFEIERRKKVEAALSSREQELAEANQRKDEVLEELAGRLIRAQEQERSRIARDLHDHLSQKLGLLGIRLDRLRTNPTVQTPLVRETLQESGDYLEEIIEDLHHISHRLHSSTLDHLGLISALHTLVAEFSKQHGIHVEFSTGSIPEDFSTENLLCLFRVAEEGLNNIAKHSGARSARMQLMESESGLLLTLEDEGKGFETQSTKGLGLVSMRERLRLAHGRFRVQASPSRGTRLEAWVPTTGVGGSF
jgi:signal transduction histidine kinase